MEFLNSDQMLELRTLVYQSIERAEQDNYDLQRILMCEHVLFHVAGQLNNKVNSLEELIDYSSKVQNCDK